MPAAWHHPPAQPTPSPMHPMCQHQGTQAHTPPRPHTSIQGNEAPRPAATLSKAALKRIRQQGPRLDDLVSHHEVTRTVDEGTTTLVYDFVPPEVMATPDATSEPHWSTLPRMEFFDFYHGLQVLNAMRACIVVPMLVADCAVHVFKTSASNTPHHPQQRNWTSKYYKPTADKWDLVFFQDAGRVFFGNFPGFRCLGTRADGSKFWVDIPYAGAPMFLNDYTSSATKGALFTPKAEPLDLSLDNYGYNQVRRWSTYHGVQG